MLNFLIIKKQQIKQTIFIFSIIFLLSKEIIINDYEIVIVYCLLTFIIFNYFYTRNLINNLFINIIENIQQEYKNVSYTLLLMEEVIAKMLYFYKWTYNFSDEIYILLNKYLRSLEIFIINNILHYNILLIKAYKYKTKINLENRKKLHIYYANKAINLLTINLKKI